MHKPIINNPNITGKTFVITGTLSRSRDEIKNIILELPDKSTPSVMKHFKQNYNGSVDMKLVSDVLKSLQ